MPRENSFSDEDGRSLTPDLSEEEDLPSPVALSPTYNTENPVPPVSTASVAQKLTSPSKHSIRRPPAHALPSTLSGRAGMSGKEKFRAVVRKVMAMRRSTTILGGRGVGAEPGVDPRRASADLQYGHIKQDCVIEVFDYSSVRHSYGRMTNKEFVNIMEDDKASEREPWVKVRWINISGLSWDVVKAVSIKYDLHPLALEDVFHTRSQTRSKADYYAKHLFLRVLCHELADEGDISPSFSDSAAYGSTLTDAPRSSSPLPFTEEDAKNEEAALEMQEMDDKTVYGSLASRKNLDTIRSRKSIRRRPFVGHILPHNKSDLSSAPSPRHPRGFLSRRTGDEDSIVKARRRRREEQVALDSLKVGDRVNVKVSPMFIFLLRDNTVISLHSSPSSTGVTHIELTKPITHRLNQRDSLLRTSADPSLLVQSLLDLIVDKALEVIDSYHTKIMKFEREVLLRPDIKTVRNLHILSGDLILHKRTLEPIKTVIYGLRRYDLDRCAAIVDPNTAAKTGDSVKVIGFMSHKSKIYLADVYDHMEYILTSLDMFAGIGENLIDYTFNMKSYEMNEVMRRLTLATIIFLPLTLLTGYFGMNFENMWSLRRSDLFFWILALPIMAIIVPLFTFADIKSGAHYIQKKVMTKKAIKTYKQA